MRQEGHSRMTECEGKKHTQRNSLALTSEGKDGSLSQSIYWCPGGWRRWAHWEQLSTLKRGLVKRKDAGEIQSGKDKS